jgi:hypothetical protein
MFLHGIFGENPTEEDKQNYWTFLMAKSENDITYSQRYYSWEFGENRTA